MALSLSLEDDTGKNSEVSVVNLRFFHSVIRLIRAHSLDMVRSPQLEREGNQEDLWPQ